MSVRIDFPMGVKSLAFCWGCGCLVGPVNRLGTRLNGKLCRDCERERQREDVRRYRQRKRDLT